MKGEIREVISSEKKKRWGVGGKIREMKKEQDRKKVTNQERRSVKTDIAGKKKSKGEIVVRQKSRKEEKDAGKKKRGEFEKEKSKGWKAGIEKINRRRAR